MKCDPLLATILAALAVSCGDDEPERSDGTGCMAVDAMTTQCPHSDDLKLEELFLHLNCDDKIVDKRGPGTLTELTGQDGKTFAACCYDVSTIDPDPNSHCAVGRPFREQGKTLSSNVRAAKVRSANLRLSGAATARAWVNAATGEHSSVAAFSRLSLQLMALGAPIELLEDAHRAALDEVRHTRVCLAMAERWGATGVTLEPFPFTRPVDVNVSLVELATDAVCEGCVNETLGAYAAREAARRAADPQARSALETMAQDEARHAALAYRIVAWALHVGGSDVRDAVVRALRSPRQPLDSAELALRVGLEPEQLSDLQAQGLHDVVQPALRALLAA